MAQRKIKPKKKRAQRATSNVFAMFEQDQIQVFYYFYNHGYHTMIHGFQEFKEAFNMIDQNRDGFIDRDDLHDMLASLGKGNFYLKTLKIKRFLRPNRQVPRGYDE